MDRGSGEGGQPNLDRPEQGEGVSKITKFLRTSFMDDPLLNTYWATTKGWYEVDNYSLPVSTNVFSMMKYHLPLVNCLNCPPSLVCHFLHFAVALGMVTVVWCGYACHTIPLVVMQSSSGGSISLFEITACILNYALLIKSDTFSMWKKTDHCVKLKTYSYRIKAFFTSDSWQKIHFTIQMTGYLFTQKYNHMV